MYVTSKEAQQFYGVTANTLRTWAKNNTIPYTTTQGGHRRYLIKNKTHKRQKIIYARVSSQKQKQDLQRQITYLKNRYPEHTVITDVTRGINCKKR